MTDKISSTKLTNQEHDLVTYILPVTMHLSDMKLEILSDIPL